jgi:hypothetical protein
MHLMNCRVARRRRSELDSAKSSCGLLPSRRLSFKWGCVALLRRFYGYPNRIRFYDPEEVVSAIRDTDIDFLLCRASLFSLVAIFEAALDRMNARLAKLGYLDPRRVCRVAL